MNGFAVRAGCGVSRTVSRALGLSPEELRRAWPFFLIYLLLFTALTMADGVSVSLFASRIGADRLPAWYSATAVLSLVMISVYLTQATRQSSSRVFGWILAAVSGMFLVAWAGYRQYGGTAPLGMLFVTREIALTMVLMHFGTFLQDYFERQELNRMLPIIYAGGRMGGIIGGGALGWLAQKLGTINLVPVMVLLLIAAWGGIQLITFVVARRDDAEDSLESDAQTAPSIHGLQQEPSPQSIGGFLRLVCSCPLLGWLTITTLLFISCRWFLAYQYTSTFEQHFDSDVELAGFVGRYTQVALLASLLLQLFVVNRLVQWVGVSSTHMLYSVLVLGGLASNVLISSLPVAVASRFVESELRFGLRNPVNQMMVNRFAKKMRIAVRGWSLGWLIPAGTLITSGLIAGLLQAGGAAAVSIVGLGLGCGFVFSALRVGRAYDDYQPGVRPTTGRAIEATVRTSRSMLAKPCVPAMLRQP